MIDLYSLTYRELADTLDGWGYSHYFLDQVWRALYIQKIENLEHLADLRPDFLAKLKQETELTMPSMVSVQRSTDGLTKKYLLALSDGEKIECVTMKYDGRTTACISSQVGCAMGCVFCATGYMGLRRNLTAGEMVSQVVYLMKQVEQVGDKLRNVVFMGMGEPLHNYEQTICAIKILTNYKGLAFAPKHMTISTVGLPEAIRKIARENLPVNLAVSLHAATEEKRRTLVPISERWPLEAVIDACRDYGEMRGKRIFFEWALIEGENDLDEQAHALGRLLDGLESHVNLIPVNPIQGFSGNPSGGRRARQFQQILTGYGIPSTIRQKRGIDIGAGCGQLRTREKS